MDDGGGIKSDSATSSVAQLGLRNSAVGLRGLRNLACATPRIAQLRLRNFQDCATLIAQLLGLRNSACATTFNRLRDSQDCATLWSDCASRIAQLSGLRNSLAGLRNLAGATPRIAQLFCRIAQLGLLGLRNLACATSRIAQLFGWTAQLGLRNLPCSSLR